MDLKFGDCISQREVFGRTLVEIGKENGNLVVFDPDVGPSTQTHFFKAAYPDRFFEVGIAEQNMMGMAAGMSTMGFIPFISAFAVFATQRAGDQIRNSIAHTQVNVKINGSYGGLPTGRAGATHSAFEDVACMRCLPGMTILEPADTQETALLTRLAIETDGPVYLRTVRCEVPTLFDKNHRVAVGKAVRMSEGSDITIISSGMMTPKAKDAVEVLKKEGITVKHLHMPSIKPLDVEAVCEAAETTKAILTVENHSVIGGLGSAVCEATAGACPVRVVRLGFQDIFLECGNDEKLFSMYDMNTENIVIHAMKIVRGK